MFWDPGGMFFTRFRCEVLGLRCEPCIVKGGDVDTVNNADPSECRAPDLPPEPSDGCSAPEPASLPRAGQLLAPPGFPGSLPRHELPLPAAETALKGPGKERGDFDGKPTL